MNRHLTPLQRHYLKLMGITVWVERNSMEQPLAVEPAVPVPVPVSEHDGDWERLRRQVAGCTQCDLHRGRTQTVFGVGATHAGWMLIGEAPGAEEDRQGEPFVGRAGQLLNAMLAAIGLDRNQVMIANIVKCRPPNNRDPRPEEVSACASYLKQQIIMVKPRIILALGRIAAQNLLKVDTPIGKMRGRRYEYPATGTPVVVTYHPAYLLRSPAEKRKSWQDLQLAMQVYKEQS